MYRPLVIINLHYRKSNIQKNYNTMSDSIGNKIKQLRTGASISAEELAAKSMITLPQLEKIESDSLIPSLAVLVRIARILGTRLGTLLDGVETENPVICSASEAQPSINITTPENNQAGNLDFFSLAQQKSDRNMEPFIINASYVAADSREIVHHEGEEFIYVLSGSVELIYGDKSYILNEGSSVYYDSIIPHSISSTAEGVVAKMLAVTYTPI